MPSWSRLRLDRQSEKDLKRRTVIGPDTKLDVGQQKQEPTEDVVRPTTPISPRRVRRMRDSVVSLSAVRDPPRSLDQIRPPIPSLELPPTEGPNGRAPRSNRFSLMKFRHASDSQLSKTAKEHAENTPPVPAAPPSIITTAPTTDNLEAHKRKSTFLMPRKNKALVKRKSRASLHDGATDDDAHTPTSRVTFEESNPLRTTQSVPPAPPAYGDESTSALALPVSRMSESSRSDGSSGDHGVFATTTTTHTVSTTTTFFRLPRRKKDKGPLFPLPPKVNSPGNSLGNTPRLSTSGRDSGSPTRPHFGQPESSSVHGSPRRSGQHSPNHSGLFTQNPFNRSDSRASANSRASSAKARPSTLGDRGRSSTMSSLRNTVEDHDVPVPPMPHSTRTSTSTAGRPSLGGLFSLSRLRQTSESASRGLNPAGPGTPGSLDSKQTSFNLPREPQIIIPEKQEGDTPAKYLARLEEVVNRSALVAILSKHDDEFTKNVMRSYMRRFKFYEDPLDMAVRKVLMHVELPKETQQIDRTLQSFADRYHECNPGIFPSPDDAYFVAFSILILHTDVFNKNNKNKMQKPDYVKNARSQGGVTNETLECFYDNISYTPFIHVEDDLDVTPERLVAQKNARKPAIKASSTTSLRRDKSGPIDPYTLLIDGKLDSLRPPLDDLLPMEDTFHYLSNDMQIDVTELNRTFYRTGIIQILSSRSRPGAFATQDTIANPAESSVGIVDIKVTKVGVLWRKDPKKKKTRSPWQEWGAILTGSQLYFFRNPSWCKNLIHQYDHHQRHGRKATPVIFKPPLEQFTPDFILSIDDAVALVDSKYKKHKNAFVFTRQNNYAEVFLADNDSELRDWLAKLNYAATYRTSGVRMKGVVGNSYESHRHNAQRDAAIASGQTSSKENGEHDADVFKQDEEFSSQVMEARRQVMLQRISQAQDKMLVLDQHLDAMMRHGRQLGILAPIQSRTRDEVRLGAERLARTTRVTQMERWRVKCHRDILAMDLEEDRKLSVSERSNTGGSGKDSISPQTTKESHHSRLPFSRLNSKHSDTKHSSSRTRPAAQKIFSMDEIFRTPSRLKGQTHKPKGSWELPPLNFERPESDTKRDSKQPEEAVESSDEEATFLTVPNTPIVATRNSSEVDLSSNSNKEEDEKERDLLAEAGIIPPDSEPGEDDVAPDEVPSEAKMKRTETDDKDGLSKVRHSLQRKLQGGHTPSHHRSKKGKESSSSAGVTDDSASNAESEQLTRTNGSFTFHGKKASIVTFGKEWENMTPEERIKRSRPQSGTVQASHTEDEEVSSSDDVPANELRPSLSATSSEVLTIKSLGSRRNSDRKASDASASVQEV